MTHAIVQKVWNFCTTLRDDGVGYGDYLEQLTYLIFLKMADGYSRPPYNRDVGVPAGYGWPDLRSPKGAALEVHYIDTLRELRAAGISISLDDFGTGFASLDLLRSLPLDLVKIDRSFVTDLATDTSDQAIVRTIIALAQNLHMDVIAEGVETDEQRQMLLAMGCTHYQGFLFAKPGPVDEFEALLDRM